MGRGRAPCCDKSKVNRGPWSPDEDSRLITFIQNHGHTNWRHLPKQAGLLRCGKSCRLRWINYLSPDVKRGNFCKEEEDTIIKLHQSLGNKWSKIASHLPGRTDNEIKNVWNTHLKKRSLVMRKDNANCSIDRDDQNKDLSINSSQSSSSITDEWKHPSSTSSSTCEIDKQPSNSINQVGAFSMPKEESHSLLGFLGPNYGIDNATCPEVNNLQSVNSYDDRVMIEIPLEPDFDFWDMLDNLDSNFQSSDHQHYSPFPLQQFEEASHGSKSGEEIDHEEIHQFNNWLKYLENELELVESTSDGDHHKQSKDTAGELSSETMVGSVSDHDSCYFQMWLSSPHNFGISLSS